jgi:hypothetical protein
MSRFIGLDVHRDFCEVAITEGGRARSAGRFATRREQLELFAASLAPTDRVVLEATGNALAIVGAGSRHQAERRLTEQAEIAYRRLVADWQATGPRRVRARHRSAHLKGPRRARPARQASCS